MATRTAKTPTAKKSVTQKTAVKTAPVLDPRVFAYKVKPSLLTQVLHVYRDNTHQDTSKVKTRGELTKTTRKMFKQKGTGNARHGSRMSPTFVGGGIAHGPTGIQPARLKINKKMKAAALAGLLSLYVKDNLVELITLPEITTPKVKAVVSILPRTATLLIHHAERETLIASIKNLANVKLVEAGQLNAHLVANSKHLTLTPAAAAALVARLAPLLKTESK